jgi:hypothetical protein
MKEQPARNDAVQADIPRTGGNDDANAKSDPPGSAANTSSPSAAGELTAEEQMALYEKDLKENDWGHQPC